MVSPPLALVPTFVGTYLGIPFVDHMLNTSTYTNIIELLGLRFTEIYDIR